MAWPLSKATLELRFGLINTEIRHIKSVTQRARDLSVAGPVERRLLLELQRSLNSSVVALDAAAALPQAERNALIAYAQDQFGDATLDVAAEFTALRNAANSLRAWIHTNFPRDAASGAVLVYTVAENGDETHLTFTTEQLATFRTQADTLLALIG